MRCARSLTKSSALEADDEKREVEQRSAAREEENYQLDVERGKV